MTITRADAECMGFSDVFRGERSGPVTPGEAPCEEFMAPHGLTARALAYALGVPAYRIAAILNGEGGVTAATALLLARRFGTSAGFWMNLQAAHDLELARAELGEAA